MLLFPRSCWMPVLMSSMPSLRLTRMLLGLRPLMRQVPRQRSDVALREQRGEQFGKTDKARRSWRCYSSNHDADSILAAFIGIHIHTDITRVETMASIMLGYGSFILEFCCHVDVQLNKLECQLFLFSISCSLPRVQDLMLIFQGTLSISRKFHCFT